MTGTTNLFDLTGRTALVTGASRGIGLAVAHGLARQGAAVILTGRKADTLQAAADHLRAEGANARGIVCHQGDPAAIRALFEQLDRSGESATILVVNAATNPVKGPLLETDLAAWQKIVDVNLTGALVTAQEAARRMLPHRRGTIFFMTSIAGLDPMPGLGAYSVSKAGLMGLTKALARELGPAGIRVNAIAPGLVETRFSTACSRTARATKASWLASPSVAMASPKTSSGQQSSSPRMPPPTSRARCSSWMAAAGCRADKNS